MDQPRAFHRSRRLITVYRPQLPLPSRQPHQPHQLRAVQLFLQPVTDDREAGGRVKPAGSNRTAARGAVAVAPPSPTARHRLEENRDQRSEIVERDTGYRLRGERESQVTEKMPPVIT